MPVGHINWQLLVATLLAANADSVFKPSMWMFTHG